MTLSIIVPVYNVEKYVDKCLDSILDGNDSSDSFEVIVVNDGSTDHSMDVVRGYEKKYGNIVVVNQNNQGLSSARMNGLHHASGDFVWFIDSDDWLERDAVPLMLQIINQSNDVDVFATPLYWSYDNPKHDHIDYDIPECLQTDGPTFLSTRYLPHWASVRYVIRRQLFENKWLSFPTGLIHEDEYFGRVLLNIAGNVYVYNKPLYIYRQRSSSIMKSISIRSSYDIVHNYDCLRKYSDTLSRDNQKWFIPHCQRLLIRSYTINEDKWKTPEFRSFYRKKCLHIAHEFIRAHKLYHIKELLNILFLVMAPAMFRRKYPKSDAKSNNKPL